MEFQHVWHSYGSEAVDDSVLLTPGTLLIMSAASKQHWRHRVPSDVSIKGPRINVTFRLMTSATFSSPSPITIQPPTFSLAPAAVDSNTCAVEPAVGVSCVVDPTTLLAEGLGDDAAATEVSATVEDSHAVEAAPTCLVVARTLSLLGFWWTINCLLLLPYLVLR